MKLRNKWNKLKTWQKGGVVGILIGFIPFFIIDILLKINNYESLERFILPAFVKGIIIVYLLPTTFLVSLFVMGEPSAMNNIPNTILWYFSNVLFYSIIFIFIMNLIEKFRKRR